MSNQKTRIHTAVVALLGLGLVCSAQAQDKYSPQDAAATAEHTRQALAEGAVAQNRAAAIERLMGLWGGQVGSAAGADQLRATLEVKSNKVLADLESAKSFQEVRAQLLGTVDSKQAGILPNNIGDLTNDLTYTPVNPPCRIFDTRNYGGGVAPGAATFRNYLVYGTAAQMAAQGGNATAGCPAPKGEPVGIAANFTAVPLQSGHLRVYPFGGVLPTVSFLNFYAGSNIANAGIVSTCYLCASDLSVYNAAQTHHIADVSGYFYPVSQNDPSFNEVKDATYTAGSTVGTLVSDSVIRFMGPTITHTVVSGDRVHITANQAVGTFTNASNLDIWPCYRLSNSIGAPTVLGLGIFGISTTGQSRTPVGVSGVFSGLVGTYNYGMCYRTSSGLWNNNEWGYVSTMVLNF